MIRGQGNRVIDAFHAPGGKSLPGVSSLVFGQSIANRIGKSGSIRCSIFLEAMEAREVDSLESGSVLGDVI